MSLPVLYDPVFAAQQRRELELTEEVIDGEAANPYDDPWTFIGEAALGDWKLMPWQTRMYGALFMKPSDPVHVVVGFDPALPAREKPQLEEGG